jgi:hypothetical protein
MSRRPRRDKGPKFEVTKSEMQDGARMFRERRPREGQELLDQLPVVDAWTSDTKQLLALDEWLRSFSEAMLDSKLRVPKIAVPQLPLPEPEFGVNPLGPLAKNLVYTVAAHTHQLISLAQQIQALLKLSRLPEPAAAKLYVADRLTIMAAWMNHVVDRIQYRRRRYPELKASPWGAHLEPHPGDEGSPNIAPLEKEDFALLSVSAGFESIWDHDRMESWRKRMPKVEKLGQFLKEGRAAWATCEMVMEPYDFLRRLERGISVGAFFDGIPLLELAEAPSNPYPTPPEFYRMDSVLPVPFLLFPPERPSVADPEVDSQS